MSSLLLNCYLYSVKGARKYFATIPFTNGSSETRSKQQMVNELSSIGDEDSDTSQLKKKEQKKLSFSSSSSITKNDQELFNSNITEDLSESGDSFQQNLSRSITFHNSTLSTDVYRSDSYQMLMPRYQHITRRLTKITENIEQEKLQDNEQISNRSLSDCSEDKMNLLYVDVPNDNDSINNSSLPLSPALSIVEKISIDKTLISSFEDFPVDENGLEIINEKTMLNDLIEPIVDVPLPLLQHDCGTVASSPNGRQYYCNLNTPSSDLAHKMNSINIEDLTLTDSINVKLNKLLLESNKKGTNETAQQNNGETDNSIKNKATATRTRKRSSTPRKRRSARKKRTQSLLPSIEDEHMETCSLGRKSCPPVVEFTNVSSNLDNAVAEKEIDTKPTKVKEKKTKEIIKVKIPMKKKKSNKRDVQDKPIQSKPVSNNICSNDRVSDVLLQEINDSIELIHNHTETCLNTHECVGDSSVEIVEEPNKSIISLSSNSESCDKYIDDKNGTPNKTPDEKAQELFSSNAQDDMIQVTPSKESSVNISPFASASSPNSLITEDLSSEVLPDEIRISDWHLLSEEENSNTAFLNNFDNSYPANLHQIFPVTCAVPNLSSITEASKEDESTRKTSDDTNTRSNFDFFD